MRVRQAIDLAIDRDTLVKAVFNDEYIPGNQFVSPSNSYYNAKVPVTKRDVAKARQLLREAGQPNLTFTLIVPPERDRQEAAQIIQAMLAEAGITMNLQTQENVTMLSRRPQGRLRGVLHVLERPPRSRRQRVHLTTPARARRTTATTATRTWTRC